MGVIDGIYLYSYRSEDEEDELEEDEDDDGSSIEEEDDDVAAHGQSSEGVHRDHQGSGVALGPVAVGGESGESVPEYSQPSKGSGVEIGSNGYAVSTGRVRCTFIA